MSQKSFYPNNAEETAKKSHFLRTFFLGVSLFFLLCALGAGGYVYHFMSTPAAPIAVPAAPIVEPSSEGQTGVLALSAEKNGQGSYGAAEQGKVFFHIAPNTSFQRITRNLAAAGLITNARNFYYLGRIYGIAPQLHSGDFMLPAGQKPVQLLQALKNARPVLVRLVIPEGLPWWETAKRIELAGLAKFTDIEALMHNQAFLRKKHIPFATAEGYLYPETYMLSRPHTQNAQSAERILSLMIDTFHAKTATLHQKFSGALAQNKALSTALRSAVQQQEQAGAAFARGSLANGGSVNINGASASMTNGDVAGEQNFAALLVLASLVEKESAVPSERPRIAGVYVNRLNRRMLLGCDPTVIYGLGQNFDGNLRRVDLENTANLYNSYRRAGLPPTPICSVGIDALRASLYPEAHTFLYFVARGDGSHVFSTTLKAHNAAVFRYQKKRR